VVNIGNSSFSRFTFEANSEEDRTKWLESLRWCIKSSLISEPYNSANAIIEAAAEIESIFYLIERTEL